MTHPTEPVTDREWRLVLAVRAIVEAGPNWMEADAVAESERRMRTQARAALREWEEGTQINVLD